MDAFSFVIIVILGVLVLLTRRFADSFEFKNKLYLADLYIEKGNYMEAIKYLEDMRKNNPDDIDILLYLSELYNYKKMYVRALKCYNKLMELSHPDNDHNRLLLHRRMARIYKKLNLPDKYFIENLKLIELDPNNIEALYDIAIFFIGQGEYDKAINYLEKIQRIDPDNSEAIFMLALCYQTKGWLKESADNYERLYNRMKDDWRPRYFLGFIRKDQQNPEAIKLLEEASDMLEDRDYISKASVAAAVTGIDMNMTEIALNILNKRMSQIAIDDPFRKDILYNLGWAYFFKGEVEAALSNWEEVTRLDMNFQNISEIMNPSINTDFDEMERIFKIYSSNVQPPTAREYLNFETTYDLDKLEQELGIWKQRMVKIAKERGVYVGPIKTAKVMSTLSKVKFRNTAHKLVSSIGYVIEKEIIFNKGVDFIAYRKNAKKEEKIYFRVRNISDVVSQDVLEQFIKDIQDKKVKGRTFIACGKYSKKAKEFAEKYKVKLFDERSLTNLLTKIADKE